MTTIDWTLPCETTEDPPRPVRVLATDRPGDFCVVAMHTDGAISTHTMHGTPIYEGGCRLRNVAPSKPEPVLREGWVKLYAKDGQWPSASSSVFTSEDNARESVTMREPLAICKVAWMSDGSPVPGEASGEDAPLIGLSDAEFRRLCDNVEAPLIADRDHWKAKAEALQAEVDVWRKWEVEIANPRITKLGRMYDELQAEVDRLRPVVDAAVAWTNAKGNAIILTGRALMDASRAYQSKQAPAEPVKNCTTCRFSHIYHADEPCNVCADNTRRKPFKSYWEPRHD